MAKGQRIQTEKEMDKLFKQQLRKFVKENPDFMKSMILDFEK